MWRFGVIIVSEYMHTATEIEDLESSLILGFGCSVAAMEAVSSMFKIKAEFKPCSVHNIEMTANYYQWLFWTDSCHLFTPTFYLFIY